MSAAAPSRRAGWLLLFAAALIYRLVAHAQMAAAADTFAPIIDSEAYLVQALRVADGRDISDAIYFQAPLYPWVLGLTLRAAGVPGVAAAESAADVPPAVVARARSVGSTLNLALGLLAVLLTALTARRLFGAGAGWCAGALAAVCSPFVFYEGLLLKGALSLLFLPWAVLAAARALRLRAPRAFLWCGLALGLGGLVRGNLHVVALLGGAVLLVWSWRTGRLAFGLRATAALALGVLLALAPVIVRNSAVAGRPVLSTAAGGTAFYLCNEPGNDTGIIQHRALNRQVPLHELEDWTALAHARTGRELDSAGVSRYWMGAALQGIAREPGTWLLAETRKLFLLLSRYEAPDNSMPSFADDECAALRLSPVHYGLLVPLAFGGALLAWRERRRQPAGGARAALAVALLAYAGSLLLFVVTSRFRLPLVPLVTVYAGVLLARLPALLAERARRTDALLAALAVLAGVLLARVSEGPLGPLTERELASHVAVCLKNRAQVRAGRGALEAARADLARAAQVSLQAGVDAPALHVEQARLARLELLATSDARGTLRASPEQQRALREEAEAELDRALALSGADPGAWRERGLWQYMLGESEGAAASLARALEGQPRDREANQYLALSLLALGRAAQAEAPARFLAEQRPEHDDGWALLALVAQRTGHADEARAALERYDALALAREAGGLPRRFPDQPEFAMLRQVREHP